MLLKGITAGSLISATLICIFCGGFDGLGWLWMLPVSFLGLELGLLVLAFLFLWAVTALVDTSVPQEHDSKFYRGLARVYAEAICSLLLMRFDRKGLEMIPKEGRFVVVCNHLASLDPVILMHFFRDSQLAFISKRENDSMFIVGKFMHKLMAQCINRENDREALKTILNCIRLLKEDEVSIGVFPEGYISKDGKLHHFRSGVFKIAMKAKVPIVVCTLKNTKDIFGNALHLRHTDIPMHVLGVIQPQELEHKTTVEVGERVYDMMIRDLGPEFLSDDRENT